MERVRFNCPVCQKSFMVPAERASRPMCAACLKTFDSSAKESSEPVLVAAAVPKELPGISEDFATDIAGAMWQRPSSQLRPAIDENDKHDDNTIQAPQTVFVAVNAYETQSLFVDLVFGAGIVCLACAGLSLLVIGFLLVTFGDQSKVIQAGAASVAFAIASFGLCFVSSFLKLSVSVANDIRCIAQVQTAKKLK